VPCVFYNAPTRQIFHLYTWKCISNRFFFIFILFLTKKNRHFFYKKLVNSGIYLTWSKFGILIHILDSKDKISFCKYFLLTLLFLSIETVQFKLFIYSTKHRDLVSRPFYFSCAIYFLFCDFFLCIFIQVLCVTYCTYPLCSFYTQIDLVICIFLWKIYIRFSNNLYLPVLLSQKCCTFTKCT